MKGDIIMASPWQQEVKSRVDWGRLPFVVLDTLNDVLESNPRQRLLFMRSARLVNRHWSRWSTEAVTCLSLSTHFHIVSNFPILQHLRLKNYNGLVEFQTLARLQYQRCLTLVDLTDSRVTDNDLREMGTLQSLSTLILARCQLITDSGLLHVGRMQMLTCLDLLDGWSITDNGLIHVGKLVALRELSLEGCMDVTDFGLASVATLTRLTKLNLASCQQITNAGLELLEALQGLRELNLYLCKLITDDGARHVAKLTKLVVLNLRVCKITNTGLWHLSRLADLTSLSLQSPYILTLGGLGALTKLTELNLPHCWRLMVLRCVTNNKPLAVLDVSGCFTITTEGLRELGSATSLTSLKAGFATKSVLKQVRKLTRLKTLVFDGVDHCTDDVVRCLRKLKGLQDLTIKGHGCLTDKGCKYLSRLSMLTCLVMDGHRQGITEEGLWHIGLLTSLRELRLSSLGSTAGGLVPFRNLVALTKLGFGMAGFGQFTDESMKHVLRFQALETLSLCCCGGISHQGLAHLANLPSLQDLELRHLGTNVNELEPISRLVGLTRLVLSMLDEFTGRGLAHVGKLPALEVLDLGPCGQIKDNDLVHMAGLTALQFLTLGNCQQISNQGIMHLEALTALTCVTVGKCELMTDMVVQRFYDRGVNLYR
eukprot:evm.model.scf_301.2 EVM.evm.TU.scf_301.2   scf_301:9467-12336(+)